MYNHDEHQSLPDDNGIAIISMSCRFPGANSIDQYWRNLIAGIESIHSKIDLNGRVHARAEIVGVEDFDFNFFNLSYKEAQLLDPQHRLLLECAWEVFEDASLHVNKGLVGVFCGAGPSSYFMNNIYHMRSQKGACGLYHSSDVLAEFMATDKEFISSRIAYKLNCTGPTVNIQAACATSIFVIQAAVQSLLLGECDVALAGAAAVSIPQSIPYYFEPGMPFSADGHCRPFDAKASGTVFGSGGAMVALKRLADALADGDHIHAVIRSVAINNDGACRAGMMSPSVAGQTEVIREALNVAGINAEQISYVETHGTGTPVGDPIEIKALANVFTHDKREKICYLGSVKGNIGHLGWASGMAGIIKAILISQYRVIPPTINFEKYNPNLYIEKTPFSINQQPVTLTESKVIIGVSSFGLGGNNAHLILETSPSRPKAIEYTDSDQLHLIPISAKDRPALEKLCSAYQKFLGTQVEDSVKGFVANLQYSRSFFGHREFIIARYRQDAIHALTKLTFSSRAAVDGTPKISLMFSGHGGEHREMGKALYSCETFFRAELNKFDMICEEFFGASASRLLFDSEINQRIEQDISCSQPMTFALQVAMARLLLSHGNPPVALFGHSLGEYAAACIAGVFSLEQGFRIVVERSRLLKLLGDVGTMLVLSGNQECALGLIEKAGVHLSIAALSSSTNTVISGPNHAIDGVMKAAATAKISAKKLNISRPGHSFLLDPLLDGFESFLDKIKLNAPQLPLISSVTGEIAGVEVSTSQYWRRQLRETVNFIAALNTAVDLGCTHVIEVGPKATLSGLALEANEYLSILSMARGTEKDHQHYLAVLGELFCAGAEVHFSAEERRLPILDGLPTYPFQRVRCWIESIDPLNQIGACSYQSIWHVLKPDHINSSPAQKVLFVAPEGEFNQAEIHRLKRVFPHFYYTDLNQFIRTSTSDKKHQFLESLDFDALWKKYSDPIDRVYIDLRTLVSTDVATAVDTCAAVLQLLRSMATAHFHQPQLCLLFSTVCSYEKEIYLNEVASSVVGMLRSVLMEEPQLRVNIINFVRDSSLARFDEAGLIELLPLTGELIISLKQKKIFVPRLEKIDITPKNNPTYPSDLTYILIGGAGGIGIELIKKLCADKIRSIYVFGRSARPSKALYELMSQHPMIHYLNFDLSTNKGYVGCERWLNNTLIDKAAIFNLAVDLNDKLSGVVRKKDLKRSFDSKCVSVLRLYQLLCMQNISIELILNFSSATSILGNGGQAAYGAASAFLDAAHATCFSKATKVLTVNWGIWSDAGKLQSDPRRIHVLKASGLSTHSVAEGMTFIRLLLDVPSCVTAYMSINTKMLSEKNLACRHFLDLILKDVDHGGQVLPSTNTLLLLDRTNKAQVYAVLKDWIFSTVDSLVGLEASVSPNYEMIKELSLKELGFDSLALVQLKNIIATQLCLSWPLKRIYKVSTLGQLCGELVTDVIQSKGSAADCKSTANLTHPKLHAEISIQQSRWIKLIDKKYGLRIIPYKIYCSFNSEHCRSALTQVIEEHRLLRAFFPTGVQAFKNTEQVIRSFGKLYSNISSQSVEQKTKYIAAKVRAMTKALPAPDIDVTWSIHFIDVGEPFFIALIGVQHLEFDGKSLSVFFNRFGECLQQLAMQQPLIYVEPSSDYEDYSKRQYQYINQEITDSSFFKGLFNNFDRPTVLHGHLGFTSTVACASSRQSIMVKGANQALSTLAETHGFSVFNAILYVYAKTMAEVIKCSQLIISAISSGRGLSEFNDTIGPFTFPMPIPITPQQDWLTGISMVAHTLEAINDYPLMHPSMLIDKVSTFSGMAHDSYFSDLGINFLNYRKPDESPHKIRIDGVEILSPVSSGLLSGANVEDLKRIPGLHLVVEINGDDLQFNFWFHTHRFSTAEIKEWQEMFVGNLEKLLALSEGSR